MNEQDIANALQQRLVSANIAPVVFENPNANANHARPFLFVQHVTTDRVDLSLAGGHVIARGFMSVTAVIAEGTFANQAMALLDQVSALFPKCLRLTITGGVITIPQPARIMQGFQYKADYRRGVHVFYDASAVLNAVIT
ncbi:MAG: phage tail terminator-like protein [Cypionkella sp.]|nr:phage tail terminator-like protein [Cypionkella sp.]